MAERPLDPPETPEHPSVALMDAIHDVLMDWQDTGPLSSGLVCNIGSLLDALEPLVTKALDDAFAAGVDAGAPNPREDAYDD